jgi:hypothetical protein
MKKLNIIRIVFVALAILTAVLIFKAMEIDACLDAGGVFDYASNKCRTAENVEYVPLLKRGRWFIPVLFVVFASSGGAFLLYKISMWLMPASWKKTG